jgi:hypothetical protein
VCRFFSSRHLRCVSPRPLASLSSGLLYFQIIQNCSSHFENYQTRVILPNYHMVNFLEYVASEERKRRVSNRGQERKQQKRKKKISLISGTVKMPIGSNVANTKSRVLKRLSKNDSVLHKVCCPWQSFLILFPPLQQTSSSCTCSLACEVVERTRRRGTETSGKEGSRGKGKGGTKAFIYGTQCRESGSWED